MNIVELPIIVKRYLVDIERRLRAIALSIHTAIHRAQPYVDYGEMARGREEEDSATLAVKFRQVHTDVGACTHTYAPGTARPRERR